MYKNEGVTVRNLIVKKNIVTVLIWNFHAHNFVDVVNVIILSKIIKWNK